MDMFSFGKKKKTDEEQTQVSGVEAVVMPEGGYVGEAERIAKIVEDELGKGDYLGLSGRLSDVAKSGGDGDRFVFGKTRIAGNVLTMAFCSVLSLSFAYCLLISIGTLALSSDYMLLGVVSSIASFVSLVGGVVLIRRSVFEARFKSRFKAYRGYLGFRKMESIDDIAAATGQGASRVVEDLRKAIDEKLIPQGHLVKGDAVLVISDGGYELYAERPTIYDRYFEERTQRRKQPEPRMEEADLIIGESERCLGRICGLSSSIKDKEMLKRVSSVKAVASVILRDIESDPDCGRPFGSFLGHYLLTIENFLDAYTATEKFSLKTKKEARKAFEAIDTAFRGVLGRLYQEWEEGITNDGVAM